MSALINIAGLLRAPLAGICAVLAALALGACGQTVSTAAFKGEEREVAQTVANLQSDVGAADEQKICNNDLASAVVARLNAARGGCKAVLKDQLAQIDSSSATVRSVTIGGTSARRTASAVVSSTYSGKTRTKTVALLKEGGKWKIAAAS